MRTITLQHPVTIGNETIAAITLRRAKVKDIAAIQEAVESKGEMAGSIVSMSRLSGLPEETVGEIDADDFVRIAEAMTDFLPRGKSGQTGEPMSQTSPPSFTPPSAT